MICNPVHLDHTGQFALKLGRDIHVLECISEVGDLAECDLASICPGYHGYISIVRRIVTPTLGSNEDFAASCLDAASRQVQARPSYRFCYLAQGEPVAA